MLVFIGTYTQTTARGIYALRFDPADGSVSEPWLAAEAQNPTFLALAPSRRHLYAGGELRTDPPAKPAVGGVSAFAIDGVPGRLALLNQQPTGGGATTHLAVDATGRMVAAASYRSGCVCALPVAADGSLGARSAHVLHEGPPGPDRARQAQAHAHSVTFSPDNRLVMACDLGLDRVFAYRIDPGSASLAANDPPFAKAPPGSGPRHSAFSADGRFLYVSNEMGSSVCAYACDAMRGALTLIRTESTLPSGFRAPNTAAEIRIHPGGRFVYVSNRGHDSIAVFSRDAATGVLRRIQVVPCGGRHPRNFALSPDGRWLLCANRDTNTVTVLAADPGTGLLEPTGRGVGVDQPVCVLFCG